MSHARLSLPRRPSLAVGRLIVLLALLTPATAARAAVETRFDANLEGWRVTGDNASSWNSGGGNPGGCLSVNDLAVGDMNYVVAPPAYLGDWSGTTSADSICADYYFQNTSGGTVVTPAYIFRIAGPGGVALALVGQLPPQSVWTTLKVSLSPSAWTLQSGTWSGLLAHVNTLTLMGEFVTGSEVVRLDNIRLSASPATVFEECVTETFTAAGLGEWSFQNTGGTSNPGSGGDGGGFCQVSDASGWSYAYAPSRFLGDWSSLDGTGSLTIDIRRLSYSGAPINIPDFIRISGPGGTAVVPLLAAELPPVGRVWKAYTFPLQQSAWSVTSGTWAGLLANVTECRIAPEFNDGTEVVGFDNFGRLSASCPEPDMPIVVQGAGVTLCGHAGFAGITTVAHNPADGLLYGTVHAGPSYGGGLWALEGPAAGTRLQSYDSPDHLIFDAAGNVYVTDDYYGYVYRRDTGGAWTLWVSGFHSGDDDPMGLCIAPEGFDGTNVDPGDILVTDYGYSGPDEVWAFSTVAAENEKQVMPDPGNTDYYDIAAGPPGAVYLADSLNPNALSLLSPEGGLTSLPLGTPLTNIFSIVYDHHADWIYVTEYGGMTVRRIRPATGAVEQVASGFAGFQPCGLEIDSDNHRLWVVDGVAGRIYEFCLGTTIGIGDEPGDPATLELLGTPRARPNPSQSGTAVHFALARAADVRLEVYDPAGRLVRRLPAERRAAGEQARQWDGRDGSGRRVAGGIYLLRLTAGAEVWTARVVILR
jgi:hypothetical protein